MMSLQNKELAATLAYFSCPFGFLSYAICKDDHEAMGHFMVDSLKDILLKNPFQGHQLYKQKGFSQIVYSASHSISDDT
jgi:hypothetical protein